ncbi:GGDEF domain-containing protein [Bacillus yapensis]|nr:GGDEF domain-containing protein [Bacillus yapensis]
MAQQVENLEELKRKLYLFAVPFLIFALIMNNLFDASVGVGFYVDFLLILYFSIGWILIYKRILFRFVELSNLVFVSIHQITQFHQGVHENLIAKNESIGDFSMFMPLIVVFMYLSLGRKKGLLLSLILFFITLCLGIPYITEIQTYAMDSLVKYYLANIIYILAFYYLQFALGTFTELKSIKSNAYVDPLTEIANRRKMYLYLDNHLKTNDDLSVILLDIDNFKSINDHYGHDVGDEVLQEFTKLISQHLSEKDMFGRWGGEEFMVFSHTSGSDAMKLAEDLRRTVDYYSFTKVGHVTASFGVTSYRAGDTKESLFKRADVALYQSKTNGKNQVNRIDAKELGRA